MSDFRFPVPVFVATNEGVVCDYVADFGLYDRYVLPLEGDFQGAPVRLVSLFVDNSANADSLLLAFGKREVIVPPFVSGWTAVLKASSVTFACSNSAKVPIRISSSKENFEWSVAGQDNTSFECTVPVAEPIKAGDLVTYGDDNLARFAIESSPHALKGIRKFYNPAWDMNWRFGGRGVFNPEPDLLSEAQKGFGMPRVNGDIFVYGYNAGRLCAWKFNKFMEQVGFLVICESPSVVGPIRSSASAVSSYIKLWFVDSSNVFHVVIYSTELRLLYDYTYQLPAPFLNWSVVNRVTFLTNYDCVLLYDGKDLYYIKCYGDDITFEFLAWVFVESLGVSVEDAAEIACTIFYSSYDYASLCIVFPKTSDGINKSLYYKAIKPVTGVVDKDTTLLSVAATTGKFTRIRVARALTAYGILCTFCDTGNGVFYWRTSTSNYGALTTRLSIAKKAGAVAFGADAVISIGFDSTMYHGVLLFNGPDGAMALRWYNSTYTLQSTIVFEAGSVDYDAVTGCSALYTDSTSGWIGGSFGCIELGVKIFTFSSTGEYICVDALVDNMLSDTCTQAFAEPNEYFYEDQIVQLFTLHQGSGGTYLSGFVNGISMQAPLGVARKDSFVDADGFEKVVLQIEGIARINKEVFPPVKVDGRVSLGQQAVVCGNTAKLYGFI